MNAIAFKGENSVRSCFPQHGSFSIAGDVVSAWLPCFAGAEWLRLRRSCMVADQFGASKTRS